jgi:hypothetical protein
MNDRWERLIDLYHSAVSLPADERATLLAEECGDDLTLQADVERMIVAHHRVSRRRHPASIRLRLRRRGTSPRRSAR